MKLKQRWIRTIEPELNHLILRSKWTRGLFLSRAHATLLGQIVLERTVPSICPRGTPEVRLGGRDEAIGAASVGSSYRVKCTKDCSVLFLTVAFESTMMSVE